MPAIPPPDDIPAEHAQPLEETTAHGTTMSNGAGTISVPMPPKGTTNFDYEMRVAIFRQRLLDLIYANQKAIVQYREDEDKRHEETMLAIQAIGSWWRGLWAAVKACIIGTLEIVKTLMANETGQLKWFALVVLGVGAIANGIAFSGFGFSADSAIKCGQDTIEVDGRCVVDFGNLEE